MAATIPAEQQVQQPAQQMEQHHVEQQQHNAAPVAHEKSEISHDLDFWVGKLNHAAADHKAITNAPGDAPWSTGFFDCFDPIDSCLITCCCPCVTFGKTHHRLHKDADLKGFSPINGSCIGYYVSALVCLPWVGNILQRHEIRQRANPKLSGDFAADCLKAYCCSCCDLIQQDKEAAALLARERSVVSQPTKQEAMTYAPQ